MLGHDDLAGYPEAVLPTRLFQRQFEHPLGARRAQQRLPAVTTEGYEMQTTGLLVALQSPGHERRVFQQALRSL